MKGSIATGELQKYLGRFFLIALVGLGVSGCVFLNNVTPASSATSGDAVAGQHYIEGDLARRLDKLNTNFSTALSGSSFGEQATITAETGYLAASGRWCRKLDVRASGESSKALVCQLQAGRWQTVRVLLP